jgi:putative transposase
MSEVSKCAPQEAIIDLGVAFANFFRDCKKPKGQRKFGHPKFKKKGERGSFCAANEAGTFIADGKRIKLPRIGWVRMREAVRFSGVLKRVTISKEADRWFASIMVETNDVKAVWTPPASVVGVDLGIKVLATLSAPLPGCGHEAGPKAHKAALQKLRRANKALARKVGVKKNQTKSANFKKQKRKLAKVQARIANIRRDSLHKLTFRLATTFRTIGIEDLNVKGMVANRCLARAVSDQGFGEFRRMLEYKAKMYGSSVVVADRFFPSSKTCSCCGAIKAEMPLSERTFSCEHCGLVLDRDLNAARNLEKYAASFAVKACGETGSGATVRRRVKPASMKQEENEAQVEEAA